MKTFYSRLARLCASGLISASLAVPLVGAAAVHPAVNAGGVGGGIAGATNGGIWFPEPAAVWVTSPGDLLQKLKDPNFRGYLVIPWHAQWDLSGHAWIPLRSGIRLTGERGPLGSRPRLYTRSTSLTGADGQPGGYSLFGVEGSNVLVQGIHFEGPANGVRDSNKLPFGINAINVHEDPDKQMGRGVDITDNEFNEWPGAAVNVASSLVYEPNTSPVRRLDVEQVRIMRNFLHNNAQDRLGYGVQVGGGARALIEGNVFDFNRHAVASDGFQNSGYVARYNYVLQGGYKDGTYYKHHFDVHGIDGGEGGGAGDYYQIAFNTIRGEQEAGGFLGIGQRTREAFILRGRPAAGAYFHDNVMVHESGEAVRLVTGGDPSLDEDRPSTFNFYRGTNAHDTDYSAEIATGDFDGDGSTDVFVANGTAWFYSRGGVRPWEFLHGSSKRIHELGFADIDNDRVTDVLYRDPSGNLGYLKAGVLTLFNFTTAPVLMKELRFGDFNGDGKTDIFYTRNGQWWIWYGHTRAWTAAATSGIALSELLFGEFDSVPGTDVAAVANGGWSYSSGGVQAWARMNGKLRNTFAGAVAADFDGNGLSDIAFSDGQKWVYSRDGRSSLVTLRDGSGSPSYAALKQLLIGTFDGGTRTKVVTFDRERLVIWNGLGSSQAFSLRSQRNMR